MGMIYNINVAGTTYDTDAGAPQFTPTQAFPITDFNLLGALTLEATIPASNLGNGANLVDVGLYTGNPFDANFEAGEMMFATNSAVHQNFIGGNLNQALAALDVSYQSFDPNTNTLRIVLDDRFTPTVQLNSLIKGSSIATAPQSIISGEMLLQFSSDMTQVAGSVFVFGNGYNSPGVSLYQANFSGTLSSNFTGIAEG
jgi:hypothetical protein